MADEAFLHGLLKDAAQNFAARAKEPHETKESDPASQTKLTRSLATINEETTNQQQLVETSSTATVVTGTKGHDTQIAKKSDPSLAGSSSSNKGTDIMASPPSPTLTPGLTANKIVTATGYNELIIPSGQRCRKYAFVVEVGAWAVPLNLEGYLRCVWASEREMAKGWCEGQQLVFTGVEERDHIVRAFKEKRGGGGLVMHTQAGDGVDI
ncbi:hypothetical protein PG994_001457 [Apiospora phragmitis]|uniref:Uncharacterized protein n=1 Tax=Apiospora phragmitis TaxID=2905665 RepID=A0ABR1WTL3_9PEZI